MPLMRSAIMPAAIMPLIMPPATRCLDLGDLFLFLGNEAGDVNLFPQAGLQNGQGINQVSGRTFSGVSSSSNSGRLSRTLRFSSCETFSHFVQEPSG